MCSFWNRIFRAGSPTGKTSKHSLELFSKWKPLKIGPNCHKSIHLSAPFMDFEGRTVTFREGILSTSSVFFWESTLEGKVSHHLKRGTMFEMLARRYPETLHAMMWRRMVCRPVWIRSIQTADMTWNFDKRPFFDKRLFHCLLETTTTSSSSYLLPSQILMRFPFFHSTTRHSQRLKNFKALKLPFFLCYVGYLDNATI